MNERRCSVRYETNHTTLNLKQLFALRLPTKENKVVSQHRRQCHCAGIYRVTAYTLLPTKQSRDTFPPKWVTIPPTEPRMAGRSCQTTETRKSKIKRHHDYRKRRSWRESRKIKKLRFEDNELTAGSTRKGLWANQKRGHRDASASGMWLYWSILTVNNSIFRQYNMRSTEFLLQGSIKGIRCLKEHQIMYNHF
jgi:hypothetical protein